MYVRFVLWEKYCKKNRFVLNWNKKQNFFFQWELFFAKFFHFHWETVWVMGRLFFKSCSSRPIGSPIQAPKCPKGAHQPNSLHLSASPSRALGNELLSSLPAAPPGQYRRRRSSPQERRALCKVAGAVALTSVRGFVGGGGERRRARGWWRGGRSRRQPTCRPRWSSTRRPPAPGSPAAQGRRRPAASGAASWFVSSAFAPYWCGKFPPHCRNPAVSVTGTLMFIFRCPLGVECVGYVSRTSSGGGEVWWHVWWWAWHWYWEAVERRWALWWLITLLTVSAAIY